jgi:hypothetical protein
LGINLSIFNWVTNGLEVAYNPSVASPARTFYMEMRYLASQEK